MVEHLLGTGNIDRKLEELVLEKTEGIPFFIEELVQSLKELEVIKSKEDKYYLERHIEEVKIPSTIQDVIMARVDSLPEGAKEVLQAGAVIDREFSYALIKRVTDLPEEDLLSRLSGLRDSELIYERGIYPQSTYVFKHALTQEVAYNSLLLKRRKEIHERIGEAIKGLYSERLEEYYELLAYHYVRSDNKKKAVECLDLASRKANKANAIEEAKTYVDECMRLLDTLPDTEENLQHRIRLLANSYMIYLLLLKIPEYYELLTRYEPMVAQMDSPHLAGPFYGRLGNTEWFFGLFDSSVQNSKRGAELCELAGDVEGTGLALNAMQWSHFMRGDLERAVGLKEEILGKMGDHVILRRVESPICAALLANVFLGRWDEAVKEGKRALSLAKEYSDDSFLCVTACFLCWAYTQKNDSDRAIEYAELAADKAPTVHDDFFSQLSLALARCKAGELEGNLELLDEYVQASKAEQIVAYALGFIPFLADAYLHAAKFEEAGQAAEELLALAERSGARWQIMFAHRFLGEVALQRRPAEAPSHFTKAISISQEIKAENELALAYSGMGRFHKQQGNVEEARKYLTDALEIFERLGTLLEPDKVRKELADLSR
jgi:predicted ATPase